MATKKVPQIDYSDAPENLKSHPFFGLKLSDEQTDFRDTIWSKDFDIVFCNARAGTGKTLIAVAAGLLMVQYNLYTELIYITAAGVHEYKQGLLPGTLEQKTLPLLQPVHQAITKLGSDPERLIRTDSNMIGQKNGSAVITAMTNSYIRGINIGSSESPVVCIVDEAQNFTRDQLKTVLTRVGEGSKIVVVGHDKQCDLKYNQDSGFVPYLNHFRDQKRCGVCSLTQNFRGWVASWADEL